ncbi:hypothetical protein LTR94_036435, partial [Friedmanniomyces endolithicus]
GLQQDRGRRPPLAVAGAHRRPAVRRRPGDADRTRPAAQTPRGVGRLHHRTVERDGARQLLRRGAGARVHGAVRADLGGEVDRRPDRPLCLQQEPQPVGGREQP